MPWVGLCWNETRSQADGGNSATEAASSQDLPKWELELKLSWDLNPGPLMGVMVFLLGS